MIFTLTNFNNDDFVEMGKDKIKDLLLNSIKDNNKFDIKAVELLYALPLNSFTLINDEMSNIYLARVKERQNQKDFAEDEFNEYNIKQTSKNKNSILKSYDFLVNNEYDVIINETAINNIKNMFQ